MEAHVFTSALPFVGTKLQKIRTLCKKSPEKVILDIGKRHYSSPWMVSSLDITRENPIE